MKLNKILFTVFFIGLLSSSCKKDLLDINVDPNKPTVVSATPELVLSAALNSSGAIYNDATDGNNYFTFAGLWMGHIGYSGNFAIATENLTYALTNNFGSGIFANIYDNIEDYDFVEKKGVEQGNAFYRGIGILMKAYNFQTLVDLYNNVPYSQALQGTANSKPAYDQGKVIYDDLTKKMDTAISLFKVSASGNTSIKGDIMFQGDANKWLQFANTVKLRLLLRQSEVNGAAAKTQAAALAGGFSTIDAAINPGYTASGGKANPFYEQNINPGTGLSDQQSLRAGQYAVSFYQTNNDPRVGKFYSVVAGTASTYQGNYFGDQGLNNTKTSGVGPGVLKSASQPSILMLAAESYFLQAEAVLRGWITVSGLTAQNLYEKGVTASFTFLGLTAAQATTYFTQAGNKQTTWSATTTFQEQLALIIRQKWAAETFVNELEPYNDYRRLRLPADVPLSLSPNSTGVFPNRLLYPQREIDVNGANVTAQGTITPGTKIWWQP